MKLTHIGATVLICTHFQIGHFAFVVAHFLCSGWSASGHSLVMFLSPSAHIPSKPEIIANSAIATGYAALSSITCSFMAGQ